MVIIILILKMLLIHTLAINIIGKSLGCLIVFIIESLNALSFILGLLLVGHHDVVGAHRRRL